MRRLAPIQDHVRYKVRYIFKLSDTFYRQFDQEVLSFLSKRIQYLKTTSKHSKIEKTEFEIEHSIFKPIEIRLILPYSLYSTKVNDMRPYDFSKNLRWKLVWDVNDITYII